MTRGRCTLGLPVLIAVTLLLSVASQSLGAQSACAAGASGSAVTSRSWPKPLDRSIAIHARDVALREALDRLAAISRVRLSYSAELVPLDRRVCISENAVRVGDALATLLAGSDIEPLVVGGDQIVLSPHRPESARENSGTARGLGILDRVVVTGSAVGGPERSLTVALDVLRGRQLVERGSTSLSGMIAGAVPGMWIWSQSPTSLLARYGSIRGASSFGLSYPKMYIDGIEVANPLLVTHLDPELLERVEVIRGPQGAALYGADAISGVVNIVTQHQGADGPDGRFRLQTGGGAAQSDFVSHAVPVQEHAVSFRTGTNLRSASLSLTGGTVGAFIPEGSSRELRAVGTLRFIGARASLSGTARFYGKEAGAAPNPLLTISTVPGVRPGSMDDRHSPSDSIRHRTDSVFARPTADSSPQRVKQYTVGSTATLVQNERWTHSLVAGVDGYRLSNVPNDFTPIPSAADSALRAARGGADRATIRASSVAHIETGSRGSATLTLAAEQSVLREQTAADQVRYQGGPLASLLGNVTTVWRNNTGLIGQAAASFDNRYFLTGGLRLERNAGASTVTTVSTLPMVGAAVVHDFPLFTTKLRASYGRGIRPPHTATRQTTWLGVNRVALQTSLGPEEQSGIEGGADLLFGRTLALHATLFDQRAFGLIQPVALVSQQQSNSGPGGPRRLEYVLQNVGEISNRGWELQSSYDIGRLSLNGALSAVNSRVVRLASGYSGDLRPGDRMLAVPARTMGLSSTWTSARYRLTLGVSRAADWINYDRLALADAVADPQQNPRALVGQQQRAYWLHYPGVTRLNASFSTNLTRELMLIVGGENLLNEQRGEPDNVTVVPGRTITAKLRAHF